MIRIKSILILLTMTFLSHYSRAQEEKAMALSSLDLSLIAQKYMQPKADQSMTGEQMNVAGQGFRNGISVHAPAKGYVYVGSTAKKFRAVVGVDSDKNRKTTHPSAKTLTHTTGTKVFYYVTEPGQPRRLIGIGDKIDEIAPGSVEFIVEGDGKILWKSGVMKQGDKAKAIDLDISGIKMLSFAVTDGGDGISGDVANWANMHITYTDKVPLIVAEDYLLQLSRNDGQFRKTLQPALAKLPLYKKATVTDDWLITTPKTKSQVYRSGDKDIVMSNGLTSRTFRIYPNVSTVSLKNLVSGEEYIRRTQPEARVMIDSIAYEVGWLGGQKEKGYLLAQWLDDMYSLPNAFSLQRFEVKNISERMDWHKKRWVPATQWEAKGKELIFYYSHPSNALGDVTVAVHYELFDNLPLFSKKIVVRNEGKAKKLNHFTGEIIAHHEVENYVATPKVWKRPNLHMENEYAFGGFTYEESDQSIIWEKDPEYTSQGNYPMNMPCILKSEPKVGPGTTLQTGDSFTSFRTYVMPLDGTDRERNTLAQRKMYRTIAPWATENPIFMHLTSTNPKTVRTAIDQCVETGYEMVILSFGSGLNMENTSEANYEKFKKLADYAHSKGIELGGYSLFSSRRINDETDVIDIKTGKPGGATFGSAPCAGSEWGIAYLQKLRDFFEKTGFDLLEHDGPYPGDFCASTSHPGHEGYHDSQYTQWQQTVDFYGYLRKKGVYMNIPDFYFLAGSNKCSIGYREVNWSLPRAQQIILGRQNIYDGTWTRTPSMGWTFVPLTQYHGGGAAATLEPLSEHLDDYNTHMIQNYGSGVQACYRGPRLYDTEKTKQTVKTTISHYKKYRDILNADIIHLKRPTGRDWDGIMHVDPQLPIKGYVMLYNPLDEPVRRKVKLPLYYTGLSKEAKISTEGNKPRTYPLDREYNVTLELEIPATGNVWLTIE